MTTLVPRHPSITEMSERDRDRLYLDVAVRWVGPTAPTADDSRRAELRMDYCARSLADAVAVEDVDDLTMRYRSVDYVDARSYVAQLEAIGRHIYARGAEGFAGWIVR